jgi:hypothetical protein
VHWVGCSFRASVQRSFYDLATAQVFGKCTQECVQDSIAHLKIITRTHSNLADFELRRKSQNDEMPKTLTLHPLVVGTTSLTIWSFAFCIQESVHEAEPGRLRVLLQHVHADAVGLRLVADRSRPRTSAGCLTQSSSHSSTARRRRFRSWSSTASPTSCRAHFPRRVPSLMSSLRVRDGRLSLRRGWPEHEYFARAQPAREIPHAVVCGAGAFCGVLARLE